MGTINYGTSEYITIGLQPFDCDDFIDDETGEYRPDWMEDAYADAWCEVETIRNKYAFQYFHVVLKYGYYEGFYIDIERNYPVCYDSGEDKRDALKEATQLKKFLLACIDAGLCKVAPGWCTGYYNRADSIRAINDAIRDMKDDIRNTPTWYTCERKGIEV